MYSLAVDLYLFNSGYCTDFWYFHILYCILNINKIFIDIKLIAASVMVTVSEWDSNMSDGNISGDDCESCETDCRKVDEYCKAWD